MRLRIFLSILILSVLGVMMGLINIQIFHHEKYRIMSEENRLKVVPLMAPRGRILDRKGEILVKDVLSFNASVIYGRIKNMDLLTNFLSTILELSEKEISDKIKKARTMPYSPVCVVSDIGTEKAVQLEESREDYPGFLLEVSTMRKYGYERTAASLLGYLGFINRSEFDKLRHYGYRINDLKGKGGVEKYYDDYLRGKHGGKQIEVDHRGRESTILGFKEPTPGLDVHLTIDVELQEFCDDLLKDKRGAIIVMDPNTGAVLTMASAPAYDPNIFIDGSRSAEVISLLKNNKYPLINRAISGAYPPGSIFKAITASSALESGVVSEWTQFNCTGQMKLGRSVFKCWRKRGHGEIDLREAIKGSCNVYFYKVGLLAGVDTIAKIAEKFGFGKRTGIDLPGEAKGVLPSSAWKKKNRGEKWYKGDTVNFSIGQGYLLSSPLQVVCMMAVFANEGFLVRPFVVNKVGDISVSSINKVNIGLSPETLKVVREGLKKVVNDPRGTGLKAKMKDIIVSGKTGTAQTSKGKSHGWFSGFAPYKDSKVAIVVFDEFGGKGGYYAAETAEKVLSKANELGLLK